ncbi:MAG: archaellin/type IV pilin N-terminal domain-containing protein [Candidatus Pacearchaeota archaeon]|jgi:flagellin-like protein
MVNRKINKIDNKGVSPVVSTVLLIMVVVVLALIILLWMWGFIQEAKTKKIDDIEKSADEFCREVTIEPILNDDGSYGFENKGSVPLFGFKVKTIMEGSSSIDESNKDYHLNPGFATMISDSVTHQEYESIEIIPVLLVINEKTTASEEYPCLDELKKIK